MRTPFCMSILLCFYKFSYTLYMRFTNFLFFFYSTHFSCKVHAKCYRALHTLHTICQLSLLPFLPRTFLAKCMQNTSAPIAEITLLSIYIIYFYKPFCMSILLCFCKFFLHTLHTICQLSFLFFIPHTFLAKCMQNASAPCTLCMRFTNFLFFLFFLTLFLQSACKMLARPLQKVYYYSFYIIFFIHHFACLYFFASTNFLTHFACDLPTFFSYFSCKVHAKC